MVDSRYLNPSYPSLNAEPVANATIAKLYTHTVLGGGEIRNAMKKTSQRNSSPLIDSCFNNLWFSQMPISLARPSKMKAKPIAVLSNNSLISV